jgi:hypothetical protein
LRVVVPYANLYPETRAALEADGHVHAEYIRTGGEVFDYYNLLKQLWASQEGFVIVEQDIVPWPGAIQLLWDCPENWCGYAYELSVGFGAYLGCTKFSDDLVAENPSIIETIARLPNHGMPPRHWARLDTRLKEVLEDYAKQKMHVHWPSVGHLNPAQKFLGAFNCGSCGAPVPEEVYRAQPWPYPCSACGRS